MNVCAVHYLESELIGPTVRKSPLLTVIGVLSIF